VRFVQASVPCVKRRFRRARTRVLGKDGGLLSFSGWFSFLAAALLSWVVANEGLRDLIGSSDGDAADAPAVAADRELLEAELDRLAGDGSIAEIAEVLRRIATLDQR
jgi:hypothetical protein